MKKLSILAVLAMVFALSACGSSSTDGTKDTTGAVDTIVGDTTDLGTPDTTPDTTVDALKDTAAPEDTVNGCAFCSPWQTCENNACKDPEGALECPYGGTMLSEDCGDVPETRCCSGSELYYCEAGEGCPDGKASCLCKLDCGPMTTDDGTPVPFCSFFAYYGVILCTDVLAFPPVESEMSFWCPWYTCTPSCEGKVCGPDGCGGECGTCDSGFKCDDAGACQVCTPSCLDEEGNTKVCGDDGCGGSCGECEAETDVCGPDGQCYSASCAGLCGNPDQGAPAGCFCDASCEVYGDCCPDICDACAELGLASCCVPNCEGKVCGDDGCGGICGPENLCADDKICAEDQASCIDAPACDPTECEAPWMVCKHGECANPVDETLTCPFGGFLLGAECHDTAVAGCCGSNADLFYCEYNDAGAEHAGCPEGMDTCLCWIPCGSSEKDCGWDSENSWMNCMDGAVPPPEGTNLSCDWYTCVPDCADKNCGYDGCGGICGECTGTDECTPEGKCCTSDCAANGGDRICGMDPCGNLCGNCKEGLECVEGKCLKPCVPACEGKECGDDGCDGTCGTCDDPKTCSEAGLCVSPS